MGAADPSEHVPHAELGRVRRGVGIVVARQNHRQPIAQLDFDQGHARPGRHRRQADRFERQVEGRGDHRRPTPGDQQEVYR